MEMLEPEIMGLALGKSSISTHLWNTWRNDETILNDVCTRLSPLQPFPAAQHQIAPIPADGQVDQVDGNF